MESMFQYLKGLRDEEAAANVLFQSVRVRTFQRIRFYLASIFAGLEQTVRQEDNERET